MKHLKILGLAAVAALALMAIGAGSASAAKVCSTAGTGAACTSGKVLAANTAIDASGSAELTSTFDNVKCTESTVAGKITNGETGTGDIESMTFTSCTDSFGSKCTANTNASAANPWSATTTATGGGSGTMTVNNVTGSFTCPVFGVNTTCIYSAASATTTVTGGEPAKVTASKVALTREAGSGGACSEKATWTGTYTVTSPTSLWLF
jgi:hypothetical protein